MKIHGGTHLGVNGLFGEREFPGMSTDEVKELLMSEYGSGELVWGPPEKDVKWSSYEHHDATIYTIVDDTGRTKFEFRVIDEEMQELEERVLAFGQAYKEVLTGKRMLISEYEPLPTHGKPMCVWHSDGVDEQC
jgi:hypothetical protein